MKTPEDSNISIQLTLVQNSAGYVKTSEDTTNSLTIALLTGKSHKEIVYDILVMCSELGINSSDYIAVGRNPQIMSYDLDEDLTLTLVTGYSIPIIHTFLRFLGREVGKYNYKNL